MTRAKIFFILCISIFAVSSTQATIVDFTSDQWDFTNGNYGQTMVIDGIMEITAMSQITNDGWATGTVYFDSSTGLGVKTGTGAGSKGISGGGDHQDEALVFNFATDALTSSIVLGLNDYSMLQDDPVITLGLSSGENLIFTESFTNWNAAVTNLGGERISLNIGILAGSAYSNALVRTISVMETTGHLYVDTVSFVPEPGTIILLSLGGMVLIRRRCK